MPLASRVSIVGLNYAPEPTGNAPYTTGLARHLAGSGANTTVITGFPHYPQWRRDPAYKGFHSAAIHRGVRLVRLWHWIPRPPRGWRRLLSEFSFGFHAIATRWHRPQAVVLVSPALFASALCMLRLMVSSRALRVVWVQDLYSQGMAETGEGGGFATVVARRVESWVLRRAHRVVAIHEAMRARMVADLGVEGSRIAIIPNWGHITPSALDQIAAREILGWDPDARIALHAGNMGRKQGLGNVVGAATLASERRVDILFVLLGDGAERSALEKRSRGLSTIAFVDPLPEALFPIALAAADILLVNELPGVREMAVPSKLTSYFAARRPVLFATASDGTVADVATAAQAGPVVPNGDPGGLLAAASSLLANPSECSRLGTNAYEYWKAELSLGAALLRWDEVLGATTLETSRDQGEP